MSRPLRLIDENSYYHIMNRGQDKRSIFSDDRDRHVFLNLLAEISDRFDCSIAAYCLMGNHFHLVIRTTKANLSEAVKHLLSIYVQRYNFRHGLDGPLFRGRFKSTFVQDQSYLSMLVPYVHYNPVRSGMVCNPNDYEWSSFRIYKSALGPQGALSKLPNWFHLAPGLDDNASFESVHRDRDSNFQESRARIERIDHAFMQKCTTLIPTAVVRTAENLEMRKSAPGEVIQFSPSIHQLRKSAIDEFLLPLSIQDQYVLRIWAYRKLLGWPSEVLSEFLGTKDLEAVRRALVRVSRVASLRSLRDSLMERMNGELLRMG